jgi:ATP/maltotriose-dependent transcriptional regulator MalT
MALGGLGLPDDARRAFDRARDHFATIGNHYMRAYAWTWEYNLVLHQYATDQPAERDALITAADAAYQRSIYAGLAGAEPTVRVYQALLVDGRWDETQRSAAAMLGTESVRIECATALAELNWLRGMPEQAWAMIASVFPDGADAQPSTPQFFEALVLQRIAAELALDASDHALAERWIACLERWLGWSDVAFGRSVPAQLRARLALDVGDLAAARRHARRAVDLAGAPRQPLALAVALRLAGDVERHAGRLAEAEARLGEALALAERCAAPHELALARLALATLRLAQGRAGEAAPLLAAARATAEMLAAQPLQARIRAVEAQASRRPAVPGGLSPRELDVLRLVAQGLTDGQIAERLFISPRTVGGHLQSIYTKLGISSRTAATAFAFEHRLV